MLLTQVVLSLYTVTSSHHVIVSRPKQWFIEKKTPKKQKKQKKQKKKKQKKTKKKNPQKNKKQKTKKQKKKKTKKKKKKKHSIHWAQVCLKSVLSNAFRSSTVLPAPSHCKALLMSIHNTCREKKKKKKKKCQYGWKRISSRSMVKKYTLHIGSLQCVFYTNICFRQRTGDEIVVQWKHVAMLFVEKLSGIFAELPYWNNLYISCKCHLPFSICNARTNFWNNVTWWVVNFIE